MTRTHSYVCVVIFGAPDRFLICTPHKLHEVAFGSSGDCSMHLTPYILTGLFAKFLHRM